MHSGCNGTIHTGKLQESEVIFRKQTKGRREETSGMWARTHEKVFLKLQYTDYTWHPD